MQDDAAYGLGFWMLSLCPDCLSAPLFLSRPRFAALPFACGANPNARAATCVFVSCRINVCSLRSRAFIRAIISTGSCKRRHECCMHVCVHVRVHVRVRVPAVELRHVRIPVERRDARQPNGTTCSIFPWPVLASLRTHRRPQPP